MYTNTSQALIFVQILFCCVYKIKFTAAVIEASFFCILRHPFNLYNADISAAVGYLYA